MINSSRNTNVSINGDIRQEVNNFLQGNSSFQASTLFEINEELISRPYKPLGASERKSIINVKDAYDWTVSNYNSRRDLPAMILDEFQPEYSSMLANLNALLYQIKEVLGRDTIEGRQTGVFDRINTPIDNPIASTYFAKPTGFRYKFPYLIDFNNKSVNEYSYGDKGGPLSDITDIIKSRVGFSGSGILGGVGGLALGAGGIIRSLGTAVFPAIQPQGEQQFYRGTSPISYSFDIQLLNTISVESSRRNEELVELLIYQNTPRLRNLYIGDAPCLYTIEIPGVRWMPACYINIDVTNVGNIKELYGKTLPEAYNISFEIIELFPNLRNLIYNYKQLGNKLEAINQGDWKDELCANGQEAIKGITTAGRDVLNGNFRVGIEN